MGRRGFQLCPEGSGYFSRINNSIVFAAHNPNMSSSMIFGMLFSFIASFCLYLASPNQHIGIKQTPFLKNCLKLSSGIFYITGFEFIHTSMQILPSIFLFICVLMASLIFVTYSSAFLFAKSTLR